MHFLINLLFSGQSSLMNMVLIIVEAEGNGIGGGSAGNTSAGGGGGDGLKTTFFVVDGISFLFGITNFFLGLPPAAIIRALKAFSSTQFLASP